MSSALSEMVHQAAQPPPWSRISHRWEQGAGLGRMEAGRDPPATTAKFCDSVSADVSEVQISHNEPLKTILPTSRRLPYGWLSGGTTFCFIPAAS